MTAPYAIPQLAVPNVAPSYAPPAPSLGDTLGQAGGDLAKVLMALRTLSQQGQIANQQDATQNRELDIRQQLGQGEIGVKNAENTRLTNKQTYDQNQATETLKRQAMAGKGLRQMLSARGVTGLDDVPDENVVGMVPELEKAGIIGPLTDAERRLTTFVDKYKGTPNEKTAEKFLGPNPTSSVTVNNAGSNALDQGLADITIDALKGLKKARVIFPAISEARTLVPNIISGAGANLRLAMAKGLSLVGGKESGNLSADTETYVRLAKQLTIGYLGSKDLGSGNAVSNTDLKFMQQMSGEDITREPETLKRTLRIGYGQALMQSQDGIEEIRQEAIDNPARADVLNRRAANEERQLQGNWNTYVGMLLEEQGASSEHVQSVMQRLQYQYPESSWVKELEKRIEKEGNANAARIRKKLKGKAP